MDGFNEEREVRKIQLQLEQVGEQGVIGWVDGLNKWFQGVSKFKYREKGFIVFN